jgi:hypothetical protein
MTDTTTKLATADLLALASRFTMDGNTCLPEDQRYRASLVLHVERRGNTQWVIRRGGRDGDVFNPVTGEFDTDWTVGHSDDPLVYRLDRDEALRRATELLPQLHETGRDNQAWRPSAGHRSTRAALTRVPGDDRGGFTCCFPSAAPQPSATLTLPPRVGASATVARL